jgi:ribosomal protein L33
MAKKGKRENIRLKSEGINKRTGEKSTEVYWTVKSKLNTTEKLELRKYDKSAQAHCLFKEAR